MINLKSASFAVLACLAFNVLPASAAETPDLAGCVDTAKDVKTALDANQQSTNYNDAVRQQRYGQEFCSNGLYQRGVAHYAQALKLLDPKKS